MAWRNWFGRRAWERKMETELRFHLEAQVRAYVDQGMSVDDARRRAHREFGPLELTKDECRDGRPLAWADRLWRDVRLAVRSLRRAPGFAAAAIATAALGIGMNTAIFSAVHAVLLKPLPYEDPERLYTVEITIPPLAERIGALGGRVQDYLEWRDADTVFSGVAAVSPQEWILTGTGEPERVRGAKVSAGFFTVLGVPPVHGRGFTAEEEHAGRDRVVVISHGLWVRRYGSDPSIVGTSIDIEGHSHVVVGVASPSLLVPTGTVLVLDFGPRIDVYKPLAPTAAELAGENWDQLLLLRLAAGEHPERGQQQLHALLNAPDKAEWFSPGIEFVPRLKPIREVYAGDLRPRLLVLLGASVLLLLIACTNIASLVLARVAQRSTELATRMAIGAGRAALVVQLVAESVVLALAGGAAGTLVAYVGVRALVAYGPHATLLQGASVNAPVLLFALLTSVLTGVACGVLPAMHASRGDCGRMLQEGSRGAIGGGRAARAGQTLVGIETALGTALLASAVLLLHSFANVMSADRGYDVQQTLAVDLALPTDRYTTGSQRVEFYRAVTEHIAALPGVAAAGAISNAPAAASSDIHAIFLDTDTDMAAVVERPLAGVRYVTSGYFSASRTRLRAGRFFEAQDGATTAIVGESLARALWPGEPPAGIPGRRIRSGGVVEKDAPLLTIVGVVEDIRAGAVDRAMLPQLYQPHLPARSRANMTVMARTASTSEALAPAIRDVIRRMDATIPVPAVQTMAEIVRSAVAERRFQMLLTGLFALVALLLGAVGVYGVVSYGVACRTRDIGLRLALGAMRRDIVRGVLSTGLRPVVAGLVVGAACAVALWTALESMLYGVEPTDPLVIGGVAGLLLATAIVACAIPALRAARLDPVTALRNE